MKLSKVALLTAAVSAVNGAVVTVTEHVHQNAIISVQGIVYVENGQTFTTYQTLGHPSSTEQTYATERPSACGSATGVTVAVAFAVSEV